MIRRSIVFACLMFFGFQARAEDAGEPKKSEAKAENITEELVTPDAVPKDAKEAVQKGGEILDLAKAKKYFAMSAGIIWIVMLFIKIGRKHLSFMQGMRKRWLYIIVLVLTLVAMILTKLQTDLSWGAALLVLTSGPFVAFLNDLIKRGVFDKEPSGG